VREALIEREILWRIAPHIIRPLRFILPHHRGLRPAWLLRMGLFLYDHLGGRRRLPSTRTVTLASHPAGGPLKPSFKRGFEYSDCWVEDARLTVLNARDAADRGAVIAPRTRCIGARIEGGSWVLTIQDQGTGDSREIRARALVNAAGPWVGEVLRAVLKIETSANVRLVKGSHIVLRRLYQHDYCYIFQNADRRILFVIPFEGDFSLIGTTDLDYHGDPAEVGASAEEIDYLCRAASEYLRTPISPDMVVWSYSGVRPLYDDGASEAQAATRDYVLSLEAAAGAPALLTIYGGKITTYRRLAEAALEQLGPHLPQVAGRHAGWTGDEPLPGGDFPVDGFDALVAETRARFPFLAEHTLLRLVRTYGTRVATVLGSAKSMEDLGRELGGDLTEAELRYLADVEWATDAADVAWRRTKLGLRLSPEEIAAIDQYLRALAASRIAAE
jgi:glycerol-3-phosphate dehydrogenase